jgi:hypothetical protein
MNVRLSNNFSVLENIRGKLKVMTMTTDSLIF